MPFSKRPILLGSYIATSLLNDKKAATILCRVGLQANPYDPILLNNIVYSLATDGSVGQCQPFLNRLRDINFESLPNETKITIQATLGLVALKSNDIENGKLLYERAIQNADKIKHAYLKNLAVLNYTRELILLKLPDAERYKDTVFNMKIDSKHKDLFVVRNDVLRYFKEPL